MFFLPSLPGLPIGAFNERETMMEMAETVLGEEVTLMEMEEGAQVIIAEGMMKSDAW